MNIFKRFFAELKFDKAVRMAEEAHAKTGERYYVLPTSRKGQLIVMDRKNFRIMKQKNYITDKAKVRDLEAECFYCTAYRNGGGMLSKEVQYFKKQQYLQWIEK